jgi:hypothetical protein
MMRNTLPLLAGLLGLALMPAAGHAADAASHDGIKVWKPYVIIKECSDGRYDCRVRMDYAPFQNPMVVRSGSYWYQKPFLHYSYGDFKDRGSRQNGGY